MSVGEMIAPRVAYGKALVELVAANDRVVVLDGDVATSTQTAMVREARPDSFYEIGIAEQNMFGIAAGMSTLGLIPYACTFAVFASKRACDQVSISIAYPALNVKISGAYGGIPTGKAGATHQAIEDIAIMRAMPNMTVVVPADATETAKAVFAAAEWEGPVYIRTARCPVPVIFDNDHAFEIGKAVLIRDGKDVTIVSTGMMTPKAKVAGERLAQQGIDARVVHVHTIKPLDQESVVAAAKETGAILTVEEHNILGGLGGAVAEVLMEAGVSCKFKRHGINDEYSVIGKPFYLYRHYKLDAEGISSVAREFLNK